MSLLVSVESAEFGYLLEKTAASKGNLSVQLSKLKDADYIVVTKSFKKNMPLTTCSISKKGEQAFKGYVNQISKYLKL